MEKYVEDVRQEKKDVPDLLEAIMRPTDPVKEESRPNSYKMSQFRPEITKIRVCTFQMSGKKKSWIRPGPAPEHPFFQLFGRTSGQIFKKIMLFAPLGLVTLVGLR